MIGGGGADAQLINGIETDGTLDSHLFNPDDFVIGFRDESHRHNNQNQEGCAS